LNLESKFIPVKSIRPNKRKKPVWMSHKALKCVKKKRRIFSKHKDKDHPAVKKANRRSQRELKKARRNFEKMLAMNIKSDSKSFYAYVRSKSKSKVQVGSLIDSQGQHISDDQKIVTHFNEYFSSVFTKEDLTNIPKTVPVYTDHGISKNFDLNFNLNDVAEALEKLRVDKAIGPDGLSPRLLKEIKDVISYPLFLLFKKSLNEASVPDDWKCANVTPIFKKGNRNAAENYRPVSLTSQVSRLFERIVRDSMVKFLEDNCLCGDSQHGFKKGRSCLSNLLVFFDKITGNLDSGANVDAIFWTLPRPLTRCHIVDYQ